MLLGVLVEPCVIVVILLFHEAFLDDDGEDVDDDTYWDEDIAVEVHLGY